jgi:hypothetical protein
MHAGAMLVCRSMQCVPPECITILAVSLSMMATRSPLAALLCASCPALSAILQEASRQCRQTRLQSQFVLSSEGQTVLVHPQHAHQRETYICMAWRWWVLKEIILLIESTESYIIYMTANVTDCMCDHGCLCDFKLSRILCLGACRQ